MKKITIIKRIKNFECGLKYWFTEIDFSKLKVYIEHSNKLIVVRLHKDYKELEY